MDNEHKMNVSKLMEIFPNDTEFRKCIRKAPINAEKYNYEQIKDYKAQIGLCIPKGFVAIDIDDNDIADIISKWLQNVNHIEMKTAHGRHFIFRTNKRKFKNGVKLRTALPKSFIDLEVDVRAEANNKKQAGYIILPDNTEGRHYVRIDDKVDILPVWLRPLVIRNTELFDLSGNEGSRNDEMFKYTLFLRDNSSLKPEEIKEVMHFINNKWENSLTINEMDTILRDENIQKDKNGFYEKTVALEFLEENLIKKSNKKLYMFDGHIYRHITEEKINYLLIHDFDENLKKAKRTEIYNYIYDYLDETEEDNNANKFYLATPTQLINLKDLSFENNTGEIFVTSGINYSFDRYAESPFMEKYMEDMFGDSVDLVYDMIGYSFLRTLSYRHSFWLIGPKGTGKSMFVDNILRNIYTSISDISVQDLTTNNFAGEYLEKSLVNLVDDGSMSTTKDASLFKSAVSGNTLNVDRKNKERVSFKPIATWIVTGNKMPIFSEMDDAVYDRLVIIPVDKVLKERDPFFLDKLTLDAYNFLVSKSIMHANKIIKAGKIEFDKTLVNKFRENSNSALTFIAENEDKVLDQSPTLAYTNYKFWCETNREYALKRRMFDNAVMEKFEKSNTNPERVFKWVKKNGVK